MRWFHQLLILVGLTALTAAAGTPVLAQDSVGLNTDLIPGATVSGTFGAAPDAASDAPIVYTFKGIAGDLVTAEAVAITPGVMPVLTLLDSAQIRLFQAQGDPLTPGDTRLTYRLPSSGAYILEVTPLAANDPPGDFVLHFEIAPAVSTQPLAASGTPSRTLQPGAYTFSAPADLRLSGQNWQGEIRDERGQISARVGDLPAAVITVDQPGNYDLTILSGEVTVEYRARPDLEPTPTPTSTPAPTNTPTIQIAPNDANYQLTIPLDGEASLSEAVSYPSGDREDRVFFDITGINPGENLPGGRALLTITATCSGVGVEFVSFFAAGQSFGCGATIVEPIVQRPVTFDSRTGSILITAAGGDGTYVQWTLTGTTRRVN